MGEDLVAEGMDEDDVKPSLSLNITNEYKEDFIALAISKNSNDRKKAADLKNRMFKAYMAAGYDHGDKNDLMNKWVQEARSGKK
ncbi:hypothetical protein SAMN02745687_00609 [Lachnospiraceae bacterium NK3A20]|nr:hypothetical protein SAMN02745687_00609 [Lachnospiraceae bacterium NK3A20]